MTQKIESKVKAKAKIPILEAVHETASDLHRLGFIHKRNMHKFDALCLAPVPDYSSEKIRALRDQLKLSHAVLPIGLTTGPANAWATVLRMRCFLTCLCVR